MLLLHLRIWCKGSANCLCEKETIGSSPAIEWMIDGTNGCPGDVTNHLFAFLHRHGRIACVHTWDGPVQDTGADAAIPKVSQTPHRQTPRKIIISVESLLNDPCA